MISVTDWRGAFDAQFHKTAVVKCFICKRDWQLNGYKIDDEGIVTPERAICPHCGLSNGQLRLIGWPFEMDFT